MSIKAKAVLKRFLKAFVTGVASIAGTATIVNVHTWTDLNTTLSAVALALIIGGINGVLMGAEKWVNWSDVTNS